MTSHDDQKRVRPTRAQRLVAMGFLGAFGLTILTVLLTGLWVRSPKARHEEPPAVATPQAERPLAPDRTGVEPLRRQDQRELDAAGAAPEDRAEQVPDSSRDSTRDHDADAPPR
jgi:hypothetical protein